MSSRPLLPSRWSRRLLAATAITALVTAGLSSGAYASELEEENAPIEQIEQPVDAVEHDTTEPQPDETAEHVSETTEQGADTTEQATEPTPITVRANPVMIESTIGKWRGGVSGSVTVECTTSDDCASLFTLPAVGQTGPISYVSPAGRELCLSRANDTIGSSAEISVLWEPLDTSHGCQDVTTELDEATGMVGFRVTGGVWDGRYLGDASQGGIVDYALLTLFPVEVPGLVSGSPKLDLLKTASPDVVTEVGQIVTYSFEVTNSGDVALSNLVITEQLFTGDATELSAVTCPTTELAVGASTTCTASYAAQQADLEAGTLSNTAIASAVHAATSQAVESAPSTAVTTLELPVVVPEPEEEPVEKPEPEALATTGSDASSLVTITALALLLVLSGTATVLFARRKQSL